MKKRIARWIWLLGVSLWMSGCPGGSTSPPCKADGDCPLTQRCLSDRCRCEDGLAICGTTCVSLLDSSAHCGACGLTCPKGTTCLGGSCRCPTELLLCGQACHDPRTDALHCGGCGNTCKTGERCSSGRCLTSCPAGTPDICGQSCVQLLSEARHCGACDKACPADQICQNGTCSCPSGKISCDGACVFVDTDPAHCGACKTACKAGERCALGLCTTSCPASVADVCFGACVDLQMNSRHCGGCGKACPAGQICQDSLCLCPEGTSFCGGRCIDAQRDGENCGGCGTSCKSGEACASGSCVTSCPKATEAICFGGCYDTQGDPRHCGGCGKACQSGEVCQDGACACPSGQTLCEGRCTDTSLHPRHCGGCAKACKTGEVCTGGSCQTSCPTPTPAICYGGCVALETSPLHCGRCGRLCRSGQRCDQGRCSCPSGLLDCGETCIDPTTDPLHCGECGKSCKEGETCQGGDCKTSCPAGQENCGGCTKTQTDPKHCGGCGNTCEADQACVGGVCACGSGRADCSGRCIDILYDPANCGRCASACEIGQTCQKGTCVCPPEGCPWFLQAKGGSGTQAAFFAMAETPQGEFFALGVYFSQSPLAVGSSNLPPTPQGKQNFFLVRMSKQGSTLFSQVLGSSPIPPNFEDTKGELKLDEKGDLFIALNYRDEIELQTSFPTPLRFTAPQDEGAVFTKRTFQGDIVWAKGVQKGQGGGTFRNNSLFVDGNRVYFSGRGSGVLEIPGDPCNRNVSGNPQAVFGSFDKATGSCLELDSSEMIPGVSGDAESSMYRPHPLGGTFVAGRVSGKVKMASGETLGGEGKGSSRSFFLKRDPQGTSWKSEWEGIELGSRLRAHFFDTNGNFFTTASIFGTLQLPSGQTHRAQGEFDAVFLSLDPQGQTRWAAIGTGRGEETVVAVKQETSGDLGLLIGASKGSTFGSLTASSQYNFAGYKATLSGQGSWTKLDPLLGLVGDLAVNTFLLTQTKKFCFIGSLDSRVFVEPFLFVNQGDRDGLLVCVHAP